MSSGRNRQRNGPRGAGTEGNVHQELWDDVRGTLPDIARAVNKSNALSRDIVALNHELGIKQQNGTAITDGDISRMDGMLRENIKLTDNIKKQTESDDYKQMISTLKLIRDHKVQEENAAKAARAEAQQAVRVNPRLSGMEFDGPPDSPAPSLDGKFNRKGGGSRTSSQPPRPLPDGSSRSEGPPSEASVNLSKTKIVYAEGDAVAFKRKAAPPLTDDWIQGTVVEVIGEGKSRRYRVKDDFPDPGAPQHYRSSASQMVPIPSPGIPLGPYESGRIVLALYPNTTTFYRAVVQETLEDGKTVRLLFDEEEEQKLTDVARRFVLDHKT